MLTNDLHEPRLSDALDGTPIERIRRAVHGARAALSGLLEAASVDPTKARETARVLNVNRGVVWRVSRVVGAEDDVTAATHIPGPVGMERLIDACRARGVAEPALEVARQAVREFHDVVQLHSGDRRTLEILLANNGAQSTSADLESARRAMFDGGCAVWGVRAEARIRSMFLLPAADDPRMMDEADIAGYVALRRLRQTPWPMSYRAAYTDDGSTDVPREEPIDLASASTDGHLQLVREFCNPRDLVINKVITPRAIRHELPVSAAGSSDPITCVFGAIHRSIYPVRRTENCKFVGGILVLDTPLERVIFDAFVHRSIAVAGPPKVRLLDRMTRPHGFNIEELESEALPIDTTPRRLGPGSAGTVTPHVPWYPRMIESVVRRLGVSSDEFIGYRVEITYPPIPTGLVVFFDLAE
jgi:hypothetical protein